MKYVIQFCFLATVIFSLSSCANRFANTVYREHPLDRKTIAVLPYEVVTTGRIPKQVTEDMLLEIEEGESIAFQNSMYHQILHRLSRPNYRHLDIQIQSYQETNAILENANLSIRETWDLSSRDLAELLGVDAVVRSSVHKTQYLTDLESYGIFVAQQIVYSFSGWGWILPDNRTSDVRISASIIDVEDGSVLWSASSLQPTNWSQNTYDVIERINRRISRRLPRR